MKRGPRTDESRQRASASAAAYWADPAIRLAHGEKTRLRMNRPEVRSTISERTKIALADPAVNARQRAGLKRAFADPALRQKISERTKASMADPALRQKISERTKAGVAAKLERQFAEIVSAWEKLPKKVRQRFLDRLRSSDEAPSEKSGAHIQAITSSPLVRGSSGRWASPPARSNETTMPTPQNTTIVFSVSTPT